jgi:hypothetical protein
MKEQINPDTIIGTSLIIFMLLVFIIARFCVLKLRRNLDSEQEHQQPIMVGMTASKAGYWALLVFEFVIVWAFRFVARYEYLRSISLPCTGIPDADCFTLDLSSAVCFVALIVMSVYLPYFHLKPTKDTSKKSKFRPNKTFNALIISFATVMGTLIVVALPYLHDESADNSRSEYGRLQATAAAVVLSFLVLIALSVFGEIFSPERHDKPGPTDEFLILTAQIFVLAMLVGIASDAFLR